MTRKQLVKAIHDSKDGWSCPKHPCDFPEKENNTGDCCWKCAEKQLAEYEEKFKKAAFLALSKNCKHKHIALNRDDIRISYYYCMLKGFDCVCNINNCQILSREEKEQDKTNE